ncbi:DUF2603 domain-containing protein [Sulfurospirillum arcachonense]|uniref:DUF2603 domain-containing protein n=1 Tax=Sulfurospirillum arcachonense TaxID=57666 RepID=UPI0004B63DA1|nr:DUF2603 domain-containing protein [Sulfurospirillum arcachonense]
MSKKELTVFEMINVISKDIGLNGDKTVIEIEKTDNPEVKKLNLKSGSWNASEPWFIVDENKKLHTMMSMSSINKIIDKFRATQEENFNLKLEKTIWQNIPIDFKDVWAVAMDHIKHMANHEQNGAKVINVDLEELVSKIKQEHPNLFLDLKDLHVVPR